MPFISNQAKIDDVELKYLRDSKGFNSFSNPNALSKDVDDSNSYLVVAFPS